MSEKPATADEIFAIAEARKLGRAASVMHKSQNDLTRCSAELEACDRAGEAWTGADRDRLEQAVQDVMDRVIVAEIAAADLHKRARRCAISGDNTHIGVLADRDRKGARVWLELPRLAGRRRLLRKSFNDVMAEPGGVLDKADRIDRVQADIHAVDERESLVRDILRRWYDGEDALAIALERDFQVSS